jgi:uncharacterized membrane protein YcaP (DUF421 family)
MDPQDLLMTALRASLVYFFLLFVVRVLGKREVGQATAFDFIVALMLGEVVDEIIYADVSLVKGAIAIGVVAIWHLLNSYGSYKSKWIDKLTGAGPTELVRNGEILRDGLAQVRMNEDDLQSELRLQSIEDLAEVKVATLEPNGRVSVIKEAWAETVQKGDLPGGPKVSKRKKEG